MLESFRKYANSWVIKILFGLLALSFVGWGIGDVFRSHVDHTVAQVGDEAISDQTLQEELRHQLDRLRQVLGGDADMQTLAKLGLVKQTLNGLIATSLLDQQARLMGVRIPDAMVREQITADRNFHDAKGQFSRALFDRIMAANNLTEGRYVAMLRGQMARDELTASVVAGVTAPSFLADHLYRLVNQRRVADLVTVPYASITGTPKPTAQDLAAYHKAHAARFMTPEYRVVTAAVLSPNDIAATIKVPEERLRDAYENRRNEFETPARRDIAQLLAPDAGKAAQAAALLKTGATPEAVAKQLKLTYTDLGLVTPAALLPELAKAAFALPADGISQPVQSPLGWHVLKVLKIVPGGVKSFDEVKAQVEHEVARDEAVDKIYDLANKLQDALAGGANVEEAAKKLGIRLFQGTVDNQGLGPDGKPAPGLPKSAAFLKTAFQTAEGQDSTLTEFEDGGFFIVHVSKVRAPELKPLAQVQDQVAADWTADKRAEAAKAEVDAIAKAVNAGQDIDKLAQARKLAVVKTDPVTRQGSETGTPLPPPLLAELFKIKPGQAAVATEKDAALVARLDKVIPADPSKNKAEVEALRQQLAQSMGGDILTQYTDALRHSLGVTIHQPVLDRITEQGP